jgi:protein arginine kinase activator
MTCEICGARPAAIRCAEVVDGVLTHRRLCEECARERGVADSLASFAGPLVNVLMGLLEGEAGRVSGGVRACAGCGRTYDTFRRTGRLGCAACYDAFRDELRPLLRRVHGSTDHLGRVPRDLEGRLAAVKELKKLRVDQERAVGAEEYEKAAELRDAIAALESRIPRSRSAGATAPRERHRVDAGEDDD